MTFVFVPDPLTYEEKGRVEFLRDCLLNYVFKQLREPEDDFWTERIYDTARRLGTIVNAAIQRQGGTV